MYDCKRVTPDFFETAPRLFTAETEIEATPDRIFDVFEDAHAWTVWAGPIQNVEWTSPKPFGVGTTRTVTMMGNMVGEEVFIAWERGKRMAFCFTRASTSTIGAFAEDYQVEDLGDGKVRVRWVMAMEPKGPSRLTLALFGPVMSWALRGMLGNFKKYVESEG